MVMFYILFVVVPQLYAFVRIHRMVHLMKDGSLSANYIAINLAFKKIESYNESDGRLL